MVPVCLGCKFNDELELGGYFAVSEGLLRRYFTAFDLKAAQRRQDGRPDVILSGYGNRESYSIVKCGVTPIHFGSDHRSLGNQRLRQSYENQRGGQRPNCFPDVAHE